MIDSGEALTKDNEGYEEGLYVDSQGYVTTGYGNCLDCDLKVNSLKEWHELKFNNAYTEAEADYDNLKLDLDPVRKAAIVDMLYNMGSTKFSRFHDTLMGLRMKDWNATAVALEHSLWYKQVGRRGKRIVAMIRTGQWPNHK